MNKYNTLGRFPVLKGWNELTVNCYIRGCRCSGCYYSQFFREGESCQTKASVLELVRVYGAPFQREENILSEVVIRK